MTLEITKSFLMRYSAKTLSEKWKEVKKILREKGMSRKFERQEKYNTKEYYADSIIKFYDDVKDKFVW